jgi:hypothetical protein
MRPQSSNLNAKGGIAALAIALASIVRAQPIDWSKMVWESAALGPRTEEHAALMLEVKLDSQSAPALMQLDTGSGGNLIYVSKTELLDPAHYSTVLNGTIAGRPIQGEQFIRFPFHDGPDPPGRPPLIGTIGLPFFERRILLLDFVAQQTAILDRDETLPAAIAQHLDFVPIDYRNGRLLVPLSLTGAEISDLCFDTGSAATPIWTTRRVWLQLTGRQPADPANDHIAGNTWGEGNAWI